MHKVDLHKEVADSQMQYVVEDDPFTYMREDNRQPTANSSNLEDDLHSTYDV